MRIADIQRELLRAVVALGDYCALRPVMMGRRPRGMKVELVTTRGEPRAVVLEVYEEERGGSGGLLMSVVVPSNNIGWTQLPTQPARLTFALRWLMRDVTRALRGRRP